MTSSTSSTEPLPLQPQIDLKIGGLVTSLQRSFLGDVSPPPTVLMESSIEPLGDSLITSSDFSNINEFINANEDSLSLAQFKNYRLSDAISDRNFLERLTNYDDSLFSKDADIDNIDGNNLLAHTNGGDTFSGNSTLQNSTDSSGNLGKNDVTFVPTSNATFNASALDDGSGTNRTFVQNDVESASNQNGTFVTASVDGNGTFVAAPESGDGTFVGASLSGNATFNASRTKGGMAAMNMETMDMLDNEQMSLQGSFDDFKKPEGCGNATINLSTNNVDDVCSSAKVVSAPKPIPNDGKYFRALTVIVTHPFSMLHHKFQLINRRRRGRTLRRDLVGPNRGHKSRPFCPMTRKRIEIKCRTWINSSTSKSTIIRYFCETQTNRIRRAHQIHWR